MRRALVHIGLPRTGTTTLQRVLASLRGALAERGVLYPELTPQSAPAPHLSHQHLGETLDGRRPRRERLELLGKLRDGLRSTMCDTVLISYEGLCWRRAWFGPDTPALLRDLFADAGFAMETLITVKPQAEYLNSMYTLRTQWLKESRVFAGFLDWQIGSRRLDYDHLARPWRAASQGRLHGVPVRDAQSDAPLLERILVETGLQDRLGDLLTDTDRRLVDNRSPGPVAVEICRRLHRDGVPGLAGDAVRPASLFVENAARAAGYDAASFHGVTTDLHARVAARCDDANARLADWAWGAPWSSHVAEAPPRAVNEIASLPQDRAVETAILDIQADTVRHFGQAASPWRWRRPGPMRHFVLPAVLAIALAALPGSGFAQQPQVVGPDTPFPANPAPAGPLARPPLVNAPLADPGGSPPVMPAPPASAAAPPEADFTVPGAGASSCSEWNAAQAGAKAQQDFLLVSKDAILREWVLGYLTGISNQGKMNLAPKGSQDAIWQWLDTHCAQNKADSIFHAATGLAQHLEDLTGKM